MIIEQVSPRPKYFYKEILYIKRHCLDLNIRLGQYPKTLYSKVQNWRVISPQMDIPLSKTTTETIFFLTNLLNEKELSCVSCVNLAGLGKLP